MFTGVTENTTKMLQQHAALSAADNAIARFSSQHGTHPRFPESEDAISLYHQRAELRTQAGDHTRAIEDYTRIIEIDAQYDERDPQWYRKRAALKKMLGDGAGAAGDLAIAENLEVADDPDAN